jgi:predicted SAM-dependent methyltransferase/GT2 family glycosyltransferase
MQKIYILLPVHNRCAVTERFIDCLAAQNYSNYHLILIDDGSTDNTEQMARARIKNITVLKGRGDWWWAGSLQQGINWLEKNRAGDRDIVLFANDDITFDEDFLQKAVSILDNLEATLLLPYLRDEKTGLPQESGVEADLQKLTFIPATSPDKINCLPTRGLFMRMADLRRVGGFHPWLLPHYWSDYEFTIRAHRKGLKLCTSADLVVSLDHDQTGIHSFEADGLVIFLRQCFSKRSVFNPVYHTIFILLTSRLSHMPLSVFRIWRNVVLYVLHKVKLSVKVRLKRLLKMRQDKIDLTKAIRRMRNNLKIIVGASATKQEGWISTEYPLLDLTDAHSFAALFDPGSVSNFLAEHVWEHLSLEDGAKACRNCFVYLRQGGLLRIAVPEGLHPDPDYIAQVKPGGYGAGADDHKVLYDYRTLSALLENAGYKVRLLEWFDEQGKFHHVDWDVKEGFVERSTRFDQRNRVNPTAYTSLIIDAVKP